MNRVKALVFAAVLAFSLIFIFFVGLPYFHIDLLSVQAGAYTTSAPAGCPADSDQSAPADVIADGSTLYSVRGTTILYDGPNADVIPGADGSPLTVSGGQTFTIIGYNTKGDWTKILIGCSTAWVKS